MLVPAGAPHFDLAPSAADVDTTGAFLVNHEVLWKNYALLSSMLLYLSLMGTAFASPPVAEFERHIW